MWSAATSRRMLGLGIAGDNRIGNGASRARINRILCPPQYCEGGKLASLIEDNPTLSFTSESLLEDYYQLLIARDSTGGH